MAAFGVAAVHWRFSAFTACPLHCIVLCVDCFDLCFVWIVRVMLVARGCGGGGAVWVNVWRWRLLCIFSLLVNSDGGASGRSVGELRWPGDSWTSLGVAMGWWIVVKARGVFPWCCVWKWVSEGVFDVGFGVFVSR